MMWSIAVSRFLATLSTENTRRAYSGDLSSFFTLLDERAIDPNLVTPDEMVAWAKHISRDGARPATIRRQVAALNSFLGWAFENGVTSRRLRVTADAFRGTNPRDESDRIRGLSVEEYRGLLREAGRDEVSGIRDVALIESMTRLCLRRSDAACMDADGLMEVVDGPARLVIRQPDSEVQAWYAVPPSLMPVLRRHVAHYGITTGPLWRSLSNRSLHARLTPHSIYRIVRTAAQKAGLPEIGVHTLRHTGCTLAIEETGPAKGT